MVSLPVRLRSAVVLRVEEQTCEVVDNATIRFAPGFPTPRKERVSPGNLVAIAGAPDGDEVIVWRWYDAVVIGTEGRQIRLWEPGHGEVLAQPRREGQHYRIGSRAYASAGLPGAEWWVCGPVEPDAMVDLDEVHRLYTDNDLWDSAFVR